MSDSWHDDGALIDPNAQRPELGESPYPRSPPAQPSETPGYAQSGYPWSLPTDYPQYTWSPGNPWSPPSDHSQQRWSPGAPPGDSAPARTAHKRRGLVIALVAAIVLVGAAVAGHFVFFSGGSGSSPRAAAKAWLDAVDAEDFTKVQRLTCAQDRNFMVKSLLVQAFPHPGGYSITGTNLTDSKHALVHITFAGFRYPFAQEANVPVSKHGGWRVCFGMLGPAN